MFCVLFIVLIIVSVKFSPNSVQEYSKFSPNTVQILFWFRCTPNSFQTQSRSINKFTDSVQFHLCRKFTCAAAAGKEQHQRPWQRKPCCRFVCSQPWLWLSSESGMSSFFVKQYCITLVELVTHVDLVKYYITHGHMYWQRDLVALIWSIMCAFVCQVKY